MPASMPEFFAYYHRPDRTSPWTLLGMASSADQAEESAARHRRASGGVVMVRRWSGWLNRQTLPPTLPADWRE